MRPIAMSTEQIGEKAVEVAAFLAEQGEVPLSTFERSMQGSRALIQAAVGWLAREDRVSFRRDGRSTLVKLREPR